MYISIDIIGNGYIVHHVVPVQVEVIDPGILVIQIPFKAFKGLRFLEQLHHGIKVEIVARQTEILIRHALGPHCAPSCKEECEDRYEH